MIGGIIANNSSGMVCGVKNNAYHTMRSIRFITTDGQTYDTSIADDYGRFYHEQKSLADGLLKCKKEITGRQDLTE